MPPEETDEPYVAVATEEGAVTVRECRPDGTTRHVGVRARVVIAELMPATYPDVFGVIVCKSHGDKDVILSVALDGFAMHSTNESAQSIDITVFSRNALEWLSRVTMVFDDFLDWAECSRVLGEAKSQQGQRQLQLRDQLSLVVSQQFCLATPKSSGVATPTVTKKVEQYTQTA